MHSKGLLGLRSGSDRFFRRGERDEQRVPGRIHLVAAMSVEHSAQKPMVNRQKIRVTLTRAREQPRRSLNVG